MSTVQELQTSIEEYRSQILHVDTAIKNSSGPELESLQNLRSDLQELLDLTKETLHEQTGGEISKNRDPDDDDDPLAGEMSLFMREIQEIDGLASVTKSTDDAEEDEHHTFNKLKTKLEAMIGTKCLAPHIHTWGSVGYHNAMICGLDNIEFDHPIDEASAPVLVLFTNPTHQEMVPCSYFLDGDCRFDADKCRFSHGESVAFGSLKEYSEPNFALLEKPNCPVLAKQKDRIWYKGHVVCCDFSASTCRVKLEQSKKEVDCSFGDLLPQIRDGGSLTSESESDDDTSDSEQEFEAETHRETPTSYVDAQPLIEWEKHTKGFGSRIMQKFGYVIGMGLGRNNEGIVQPVSAQILPVGRSLDHCMELREKANGDRDLFSVERRLKRNKKVQEQRNVKAYEREVRNVDVFSFMNDTVFAGMAASGSGIQSKGAIPKCANNSTTTVQPIRQDLKSHSNKNLNVTSYKIEQDIRKVEQEIYKLRESMTRHKSGTPIFDQLRRKLDNQTGTLNDLKRSESSVAREQAFRKDKSKLTIF